MNKKFKPDYNKKQRKVRFFESLPEISSTVLQIVGHREVLVDGCRGVVDYYDDRITLKTADGTVTLLGASLIVEEYLDGKLKIKGTLQSIEFLCQKEGG
ncbi:MAG: YabP/YqfC family sporulation protein [Clostridia bacterium]|nr:YabP/YqfC family sporulation protein [Clostridia bacterium]